MKNVLLAWPLDFIKLFTWDKSFRNNRIIGSYWLNRMGLHVFRLLLSHALFNFRLMLLSPLLDASLRKQFRHQGFLKIESFLTDAQFADLRREIESYRDGIREEIEGGTITQRLYLTEPVLESLPECHELTKNNRLLHLLRYTSSKNRIPFFHLENIVHHQSGNADADPQKDFHSDTFHPCVKAWLYMDPVTDQNGPFTVIPGSHRLTWRRIRWEYRQSLLASRPEANMPGQRYWDGSFRFTDEDIEALGYGQPWAVKVPANTLLIANVHAIHRRGEGVSGASRLTVWMQARDNPFNPFFSLWPETTAKVFEFFWTKYMTKRTARQIRNGSWRLREGGFSLKGSAID